MAFLGAVGYFSLARKTTEAPATIQEQGTNPLVQGPEAKKEIQKTVVQPTTNEVKELCGTTSSPIIQSISPPFGPTGTEVVIKGCNLASSGWGLYFKNLNILYPTSPSVLEVFPIFTNADIINTTDGIKFNIPAEICVAWPWYEKGSTSSTKGRCIKSRTPYGSYEIMYSNGNDKLSSKVQFTITE